MRKSKVMALAAAGAAAALVMSGCSKGAAIDDKDPVITAGSGEEINYGTANTYVRISQADTYGYMKSIYDAYGMAMGNVWDTEMSEGETYGEQFKGELMGTLKEMLASDIHKDEYGVQVSQEEQDEINGIVHSFYENTDSKAIRKAGISEEGLGEILRLMAVRQKVRCEIVKGADPAVDEDASMQTTIQYVTVEQPKENETQRESGEGTEAETQSERTAEEIAAEITAALDDGGDFAETTANEGLTAQTMSFASVEPSGTLDDEMCQCVQDMSNDGEYASYTDSNGNIVIIYLQALYDKEASQAKAEEIVGTRMEELYGTTMAEWTKDMEVDEDAWDSIKVSDEEIFLPKPDETETEPKGSITHDGVGVDVELSTETDETEAGSASAEIGDGTEGTTEALETENNAESEEVKNED